MKRKFAVRKLDMRTGVEHTSRPFIDCYSYLHRYDSIVSTCFKEAVDKKILTEIHIRLRAPSSDRDLALRASRDSALRAPDSISNSLGENEITDFPGNSKFAAIVLINFVLLPWKLEMLTVS